MPRLPDWLVYLAIVAALLIAAIGRRERADAPPPPPPMAGADSLPLGPSSPFDPAVVVDAKRLALIMKDGAIHKNTVAV